MKVYCVITGEQSEGGDLLSVHKNESTAVDAALAVRSSSPWEADMATERLIWHSGCDFVEVLGMEVVK